MKTTTIRLPDDLYATLVAESELLGISQSEYLRQAALVRIAWMSAVRAVQAGADPKQLGDWPWLIDILENAARRLTTAPKPGETSP